MNAPGILDHPFGAAYAKRLGPLPGAASTALDALRQRARLTLGSDGLPGPKLEEWRFTPLRAFAKVPFIPAAAADDVEVAEIPRSVPVVPDAARIVLVNGNYRPDLSDQDFGGVGLSPLSVKNIDARNMLGHLASPTAAPLVALNTAYMAEGLALHVHGRAKKTLHIISIGAAGAEPVAFHPRLLIAVEPDAALTVVESHVGLPGQPYFSNPVTEIVVGEGSNVRRYVHVAEDSEAFHLATSAIAVAEKASFEAFHLGLGGALVRQEIRVSFGGNDASVKLNGAYALSGRSHHDFTTFIDHHLPSCTSNQVFKGVADGESRGVYQGRIHVARDAQKTDARQVHKALFLSRGPQIDVKPELEIYADDVQCAHGAATGEIDPAHLFYLLSRGIDPETARNLLIEGFLGDAVSEISDATVRDIFGAEIGGWLKRRQAAQGRHHSELKV
jgi:Fe-S cluster assembly protein SufD